MKSFNFRSSAMKHNLQSTQPGVLANERTRNHQRERGKVSIYAFSAGEMRIILCSMDTDIFNWMEVYSAVGSDETVFVWLCLLVRMKIGERKEKRALKKVGDWL